MTEETIQEEFEYSSINTTKPKKIPKQGIIYLSTIPPYMNVTRITEFFNDFGKVGRVYLQLAETEPKPDGKRPKKRKFAKKFTEGWVEFERKSVAKRVAMLLNNTQVSNRKKSKHYDTMWNIKYLSNFKWIHLNERLAYERAARKQKLRTEIQLAKKKANFFTNNLDKRKKNKSLMKNEVQTDNRLSECSKSSTGEKLEDADDGRTEFLGSLFN